MLLDDKKANLFVRRSSRDGRTGDIVSVIQTVGVAKGVFTSIKKMGYNEMDELEFHKMMTGEILRDKIVDEKSLEVSTPVAEADKEAAVDSGEEVSEKKEKAAEPKKAVTKRVRKIKKAE